MNKILNKIADKALKSFHTELKKEGLGSSDLNRSVTYKVAKTTIQIEFKQYGEYVDSGRKKGSYPPIKELSSWAKSKGLNVYAVANSINKHGIKAKPWIKEFMQGMLDIDEEMFEMFDNKLEEFDNKLRSEGFTVK